MAKYYSVKWKIYLETKFSKIKLKTPIFFVFSKESKYYWDSFNFSSFLNNRGLIISFPGHIYIKIYYIHIYAEEFTNM